MSKVHIVELHHDFIDSVGGSLPGWRSRVLMSSSNVKVHMVELHHDSIDSVREPARLEGGSDMGQ